MAALKRAIPWWGVPLNWIVGKYRPKPDLIQILSTLLCSLFRKSRWQSVLCRNPCEMSVRIHWLGLSYGLTCSYRRWANGGWSLCLIRKVIRYVSHFILIWKSHCLNPCASTKAITPEWYQIFLRGIGCNWLVCIAVWVRISQCCSESLLTGGI